MKYAALIALTPAFAAAQALCGKTAEVEKHLLENAKEVVVLEADYLPGFTWQVFMSPNRKGGTVAIKRPDGLTCITDMLENFRLPEKKPAPKQKKPEVML